MLCLSADHQKWTDYFGCERIIHFREANRRQGTDGAERKLRGDGPWLLADRKDDVQIIHTPGMGRLADLTGGLTAGTAAHLRMSDRTICTAIHIANIFCNSYYCVLSQVIRRAAYPYCLRPTKRSSLGITWRGPAGWSGSAS